MVARNVRDSGGQTRRCLVRRYDGPVARKRAQNTNPRALVGDGGAHREGFAQCRLALDALEAALAPEVGSGGNVDLLRTLSTRLRFDSGADLSDARARRSLRLGTFLPRPLLPTP